MIALPSSVCFTNHSSVESRPTTEVIDPFHSEIELRAGFMLRSPSCRAPAAVLPGFVFNSGMVEFLRVFVKKFA